MAVLLAMVDMLSCFETATSLKLILEGAVVV